MIVELYISRKYIFKQIPRRYTSFCSSKIYKNASNYFDDNLLSQDMDFESMWHSLTPYCSFVFEPRDRKVTKIYCEFSSHQKGEAKPKVVLKLSDECAPVSNMQNAL